MVSNSSEVGKCEKENDFTNCIPEKLMKALHQCIECGKCVGTCTAARVSDFNSREIVQKVLDKDESVLTDENLWKCFLCHYCWMVCPKKDMDLPELIFRLREISIEKGYAPKKLSKLTHWLDRFFKNGKIAGPNFVSTERVENLKEVAKEQDVEVLAEYVKKLDANPDNEEVDKQEKDEEKTSSENKRDKTKQSEENI
ncbi:MAG: 4Fe-4S dicluster domain-containing protein [Candidatus Lokiarchaeota archaeon]|nr:4Fe-4S dicluster domain-containing protein [Candidatus Lokiarchaeota archaeon]